ncbi:hypothetical protein [Ventosimonas gracilis]|uniref:hypothetical protein n=1 Tax=Ventosimonas gracilis TaxID=1680762 RepID=UPI00128EDDFE|nr:hypothetical protein [Ventosimonas gracilis]
MKTPERRSIKPSLLLFTLTAGLLTGSPSYAKVPGCSDQAAHNLLIKIALDSYKYMKQDPERHRLSITTIRTRSTDDKTGAHECAANFVITNPENGKWYSIPITYLIERLDNSPDSIHVEVENLQAGVRRALLWSYVEDPIEITPTPCSEAESKSSWIGKNPCND